MADRLDVLSTKLNNLAEGRYYETLRGISNNWKGENSAAYLRKGEVVRDRISDSSRDLKKAAQTVRTIARNTYNAEMRAYRIAQTKNQ